MTSPNDPETSPPPKREKIQNLKFHIEFSETLSVFLWCLKLSETPMVTSSFPVPVWIYPWSQQPAFLPGSTCSTPRVECAQSISILPSFHLPALSDCMPSVLFPQLLPEARGHPRICELHSCSGRGTSSTEPHMRQLLPTPLCPSLSICQFLITQLPGKESPGQNISSTFAGGELV